MTFPEKQMEFENKTVIKDFWILGIQNFHHLRTVFFPLFLSIYILTILANSMIILVVFTAHLALNPMYLFLSHLSFTDILLSSNIVPEMLHIILIGGSKVPLGQCFTQFYFFSQSTITECFLLTLMSYDRYLAICDPLHYASIMELRRCIYLIMLSWMPGLFVPLQTVIPLYKMTFCRSNAIDHFFCDLAPILQLSCSDTSAVVNGTTVLTIPIVFIPITFIIVTYIYIFLTILKIPTISGRHKAFSTCSSHLTVVCAYYGSLIINYVVPSKGKSLNLQKMASLLYTVLTPLFNPIIYSLRNSTIRGAIRKYVLKQRENK